MLLECRSRAKKCEIVSGTDFSISFLSIIVLDGLSCFFCSKKYFFGLKMGLESSYNCSCSYTAGVGNYFAGRATLGFGS